MQMSPADQDVRLAISDILSKFLSNYEWSEGSLATLTQLVDEKYKPSHVDAQVLTDLLSRSHELRLREQRRFLFLEPLVDEEILPLLTLETSNQWVNFRAYVLLTMLDQFDELQAIAIRFETDEGARTNGVRGAHDFCHAQLCRQIEGATQATTPSWLPDSQPSLPLDAEDQIGLVLCMLTALYGGRRVVERINTAGDKTLREHLKKVRALS